MKLILKGTIYELTRKEVDGILGVFKKIFPKGIYAVEKDDVVEMKNQPYKYTKNLNKAVAEYVKRGFKVYYNGG